MISREYTVSNVPFTPFPETYIREGVFFDIETTGFRATSSRLYLIGIAFRSGDGWILRQWMSEKPEEEAGLLLVFAQFLRPFRRVIHFNGDCFDIPYLQEKYAAFNMEDPFEKLHSTDIYRDLKPLRKLLSLKHMNQKSLEVFLGICREDCYDGGQLIDVYRQYCRQPSEEALDLLLLHNKEDVAGMLSLLSLYAYLPCREIEAAEGILALMPDGGQRGGLCCVCSRDSFVMTGRLACPVPVKITLRADPGEDGASCPVLLCMEEDRITVSVGFLRDTLYCYLDNYRDYDYLPQEDRAVHKSVSQFVDRQFRRPATRKTCYVKKQGVFLPQPEEIVSPVLRRGYKDKMAWLAFSDEMADDRTFTKQYFVMMVRWLCK